MSETAETNTRETLYISDEELIRRLGAPRRAARAAIHMLDRTPGSGFPKKQALWGNRRFWPAVEAYLYRTNGLKLDAPPTIGGRKS